MASFELECSQQFPDGTVVGAYRNQPHGAGGKPMGNPDESATVSGGTASFTNLTAGQFYWAIGDVGGEWRSKNFVPGADTALDQRVDGAELAAAVAAEASARDTAIETHRADTSTVHGIADTSDLPTKSGAETITGGWSFTADTKMTRVGLGGFDPILRRPLNFGATVNGPAVISEGDSGNVVAQSFSPMFTGSFTGIGGSDAGYAWGANDFASIGSSTGDGAGLTTFVGREVEIALRSPNASLNYAVALKATASFWGASCGTHVNTLETARISAPKRDAGATGGTVGNVYTLHVEEATAAAVGATGSVFSLLCDGAARFQKALYAYGDVHAGANLYVTTNIACNNWIVSENGKSNTTMIGGNGPSGEAALVMGSGGAGQVKLYRREADVALFDKAFGTSATSLASSSLSAGQLGIWFDPTPGSCKVQFKGKDTAGTIVTGSVTLA